MEKASQVVVTWEAQTNCKAGSIIGRNESAPLGAVIPGVAVVEAGIIVVVVTPVADGVGVGDGVVGGLTGNSAVAPGIVVVLGNQSTGQVINAYHIAQRIAVEIVVTVQTVHSVLHTDDGIAVINESDLRVFFPGAVAILCDGLRNQPAKMVITEMLAAAGHLAHIDRAWAGHTFQVGIGLGNPLAKAVVDIRIDFRTAGKRTAPQLAQPPLRPGTILALVRGRWESGESPLNFFLNFTNLAIGKKR